MNKVMWKHDCPMRERGEECGYDIGGKIWEPNEWAQDQAATDDHYTIARALGLTADPPPEPDRPYVMVDWECRPGVLQMHYTDELEPA